MAQRYLKATGNWTGSIWADTPSGAAGSAATPTSADSVLINNNYTVTLNQNVTVGQFSQTTGSIITSGYNFTSLFSISVSPSPSSTATFNITGSIVEATGQNAGSGFSLNTGAGYGTINFTSTGSKVVLNVGGDVNYSSFNTGSKTFSDVVINMGQGMSSSTTLRMTGSPVFRTLIMQNKSNYAHTVQLDPGATVTADNFIAIGSSTTNRLSIAKNGTGSTTSIAANLSFYGQYLSVSEMYPSVSATSYYAGSNSILYDSGGFLIQDPPKLSSFVDMFDTGFVSQSKWNAVTYTDAQGPYSKAGDAPYYRGYGFSNRRGMISKNTFDAVDSSIVVEIFPVSDSLDNNGLVFFVGWADSSGNISFSGFSGISNAYNGYFFYVDRDNNCIGVGYTSVRGGGSSSPNIISLPTTDVRFIKMSFNSVNGAISFSSSPDGSSWTLFSTVASFSAENILLMRNSRIYVSSTPIGANAETIELGSVNSSLINNSSAFFQFFRP